MLHELVILAQKHGFVKGGAWNKGQRKGRYRENFVTVPDCWTTVVSAQNRPVPLNILLRQFISVCSGCCS